MEYKTLASFLILIGVCAAAFQAYVILNLRKFKVELAEQGAEISGSIVFLMRISDFIAAYWYLTVPAAIVPIAIGISILNSKDESHG